MKKLDQNELLRILIQAMKGILANPTTSCGGDSGEFRYGVDGI